VYLVTDRKPRIYICEESAATMEQSYKPFHQEEGIIVVQAFDNLFEEALGFRISSEYGGHGTAEE
jgi:hypothetical protein